MWRKVIVLARVFDVGSMRTYKARKHSGNKGKFFVVVVVYIVFLMCIERPIIDCLVLQKRFCV